MAETPVPVTLVVNYGDGVDSSLFSLALLDDFLNRDARDEVITSFAPGDLVNFLVQVDPALRIDRVVATHGQVVSQGYCLRERTDQLLFAELQGELSAIPAGALSAAWYGRAAAGLKASGRQLTVTGSVPALGDITYSARFAGYVLHTPMVELAADEEYPIIIVIYIEAVE